MAITHSLVRLLQMAFFIIVLGIAAYMVSRNDQFHKHDHLAGYLTFIGVVGFLFYSSQSSTLTQLQFGVIASMLGLVASCMSSLGMAIGSMFLDALLCLMTLIGAIVSLLPTILVLTSRLTLFQGPFNPHETTPVHE
jgi:hypothetical protein